MQRERVTSIRLKINGRIDRAREELWDELWGPDTIAVAAASREVVLASDELSRGVNVSALITEQDSQSEAW